VAGGACWPHTTEETLRVLQALQTGELCPVNWRPGQQTLGEAS
jgi:alkyl hydroperoxide reductase subunit AhpC